MYDSIVYLLIASGSLHPTPRGGLPREKNTDVTDAHYSGCRPLPPASRRARWFRRVLSWLSAIAVSLGLESWPASAVGIELNRVRSAVVETNNGPLDTHEGAVVHAAL